MLLKNKSLAGKLMLLCATLIWGTSFFILKQTIDAVPTCFVLGVRFLFAAVILAAVLVIRKPHGFIPKGKTLLKGLAVGAVLTAAYLLQTFGLGYTSPAKNAFLTSVYVIIVPFLSFLFFRKKPSVYNIIAALLSLVGVLTVSFGNGEGFQLGDALTFSCGLFYALQIIFLGKFGEGENMTQLVMTELFTVGAICMIISAVTELPRESLSLGAPQWLAILYLAVAATCIAQTLQAKGQSFVSDAQSSLILSLEAVFGSIFSAIFYGENFTPNLIIGFSIIFIAIIISETQLKFLKAKKPKDPNAN